MPVFRSDADSRLGPHALALVRAPKEIAEDEECDEQQCASVPRNSVQNPVPPRDVALIVVERACTS